MAKTHLSLMNALETWESVSVRFENVLTAYHDACTLVDSCAVERLFDASDVLSRLERGIDLLGNRLMQQFAGSRSHLTRARNKLATSVYHLPDEILANIFLKFINDSDREQVQPIEEGIRSTYRRLYTLTRVCADWRKLGLSHGAFWSLVPVPYNQFSYDVANLSLERARGVGLYLAGTVHRADSTLPDFVAEHGPRFCAVNLHGESSGTLCEIAASLLKHSVPGHLTSLSIRYQPHHIDQWNPQPVQCYAEELLPPGSYEHAQIQRLIGSLLTLRLGGFKLDWGNMRFSSLVELKIQDVKLDDISMAENILLAAASSPTLRSLELISVIIDYRPTWRLPRLNWKPRFTVSLPHLQSLYLQDLYKGLLHFIFWSISPGPYKVTLMYTVYECLSRHSPWDDLLDSSLDSLELPAPNIHTLVLANVCVALLRFFLESIPSLKTIYIRTDLGCHTFRRVLQALVHPTGTNPGGDEANSLKLNALYISSPSIDIFESDLAIFKDAITSRGIQELGLSGPLNIHAVDNDLNSSIDEPKDDDDAASIKQWLGDTSGRIYGNYGDVC